MGGGSLGGAFEGTQGGKDDRKKIAPKRGKRKDKRPSWAEGEVPKAGESGKEFAKRIMEKRLGKGSKYDTGPGSNYSQLKKFADTHFAKDSSKTKKKRKKK